MSGRASSSPPTAALASVTDLHYRYGRQVAVEKVDFTVHRGRVLGLLGPNGAGKTTTMDCLCAVRRPHGGQIEIDGIDVLHAGNHARGRIGYLPEHPPLYPELRVSEYLHFCAAVRLRDSKSASRTGAVEERRQVQRALERCDLTAVARRRIGALSKGFQQRVGLAQALVHEPALIVLDEPTVGLDPNQVQSFRALVRELAKTHGVVLSTHILSEVEAICDEVVVIDKGHVVLNSTLEQLERSRSASGAEADLLLRFEQAPAAADIAALAGVSAVRVLDEQRLYVSCASLDEATDAILAASAAHRWRLREWVRERAALESVFVSLTRGDLEPAPSGTIIRAPDRPASGRAST